MKIAVCIKQVVTREWQVRINDSKTWVRDQDASWELNEPDAYALEESLRLREKHGGEVIVVSAGPARVTQVLREALARGADRAVHVDLVVHGHVHDHYLVHSRDRTFVCAGSATDLHHAGYNVYEIDVEKRSWKIERRVWNGARYRAFRAALASENPPDICRSCGIYNGTF